MGSIEKRQKTRGVLNPKMDEINACVEPYRKLYDAWKDAHRRRITARQLRANIRVLRQAKSILQKIAPDSLGEWALELVKYRVLKPVDVSRLFHSPPPIHVICVDEAIRYLGTLLSNGRPRTLVLGDCANALARLYKQKTGKYQWNKVGEELAKRFPDALRSRNAEGDSDLYLWILQLAKRSRRYNQRPELGTQTILLRDFSQSKPTFFPILSFSGKYLARYSGWPKTDLMTAIYEFNKSPKEKDRRV